MQVGIFLPTFGPGQQPEFLAAVAQAAEAVGVAALWAPEHVILTDEYTSAYPYSDDGRFPLDPSSGGLADPFAVLTYLAALTSTVRLGTGICLVPQRNPVYTAKMVACLDVLSHGRFDFGVGIGWLAEEFATVGAEFAERAGRTRAYLEVMRRLWTEAVTAYDSPFYRLSGVRFEPKPVQRPHPPIIFGGESDAALRRVADIGQGWFGWNITPAMAAERIGALDRLLAARGRTRAGLRLIASPYTRRTQDLDAMKRYRDAGVEQVVLLIFSEMTPDAAAAYIEDLGNRVIEPARKL